MWQGPCAQTLIDASGCHRGQDGRSSYGLPLTGVTSSGVPFLELIQPLAVDDMASGAYTARHGSLLPVA